MKHIISLIIFLSCSTANLAQRSSGSSHRILLPVRPDLTTQSSSLSRKTGEIRLDQKLSKDLTDFFSVFAQTKLQFFERDKVKDETLIGFALDRILKYDEFKERIAVTVCDGIDEKTVEAVVAKYFEARIKQHKSAPSTEYPKYTREYKNGCYLPVPADAASGDTAVRFSKVTKLTALGNGYYEARIDVYKGEEGETEETPVNVAFLSKMRAIFKQVISGSNGAYRLVNYQKM